MSIAGGVSWEEPISTLKEISGWWILGSGYVAGVWIGLDKSSSSHDFVLRKCHFSINPALLYLRTFLYLFYIAPWSCKLHALPMLTACSCIVVY
jgi:hypothetical protein